MKSRRSAAIWATIVVLFVVIWWFFISDWMLKPRTYRTPALFTIVVLVSSSFHVQALWRFIRMTRLVASEEKAGLARPGSTAFAANQRFRYLARVVESSVVLVVAIVSVVAVTSPSIALNKQYARLVILYFVGSIVVTGYLTVRDLRVINYVRDQNFGAEDATLTAAQRDVTQVPIRRP